VVLGHALDQDGFGRGPGLVLFGQKFHERVEILQGFAFNEYVCGGEHPLFLLYDPRMPDDCKRFGVLKELSD